MKKLILTFLLLLSAVTYAQELQKDSLIYSTRPSCVYDNRGLYDYVTATVIDSGDTYIDTLKFAVITTKGSATNPQSDTVYCSVKDLKLLTIDSMAVSSQFRASGSQLYSKKTYLINVLAPEKVIVYSANTAVISNRKTWITFNGKNAKSR